MYDIGVAFDSEVRRAMWSFIIPILTLLAGLAAGFAGGVFYLRKQIEKMQTNPEMLQQMAKKMGYNLNKQQMNQMQQMMRKRRMK